eukprot:367194_1
MGNDIFVNDNWECTDCSFVNQFTDTKCSQCNCKSVCIPVGNPQTKSMENWPLMRVSYSAQTTIQMVLDEAKRLLTKKHQGRALYIATVHFESFLSCTFYVEHIKKDDTYFSRLSTPITKYRIKDIMEKGLILSHGFRYLHNIQNTQITCKHLELTQNNDPLNCPIYAAMKNEYKFTEQHLNHILEFTHFQNDFKEKPECKYKQKCRSFVRMRNGGNRLDDRCHMLLYRHPPRNDRQIKLQKNTHSFEVDTKFWYDLRSFGGVSDKKKIWTQSYGYIDYLIEEVVSNGFEKDLGKNNETWLALKYPLQYMYIQQYPYDLLKIVAEKYNHIRHKQMNWPLRHDHILALLLYTGCDCNYDLCSEQRKGNYEKWKWFDFILYEAIEFLSECEVASYKLYSGLSKVKLDKKEVRDGCFRTYVSTSWVKNVALSFMDIDSGGHGMVLEFDKSIRRGFVCCDVSWLSKFPDECEVLIGRSGLIRYNQNAFSLKILDENNGIQTVSVNQMD